MLYPIELWVLPVTEHRLKISSHELRPRASRFAARTIKTIKPIKTRSFDCFTARPASKLRRLRMDTIQDLNIEDAEMLERYLRQTGRLGLAETPRLATLPGGISNRTVLVERTGGASFVLKQALAKLRVATNWPSDPRRIHQEALGL